MGVYGSSTIYCLPKSRDRIRRSPKLLVSSASTRVFGPKSTKVRAAKSSKIGDHRAGRGNIVKDTGIFLRAGFTQRGLIVSGNLYKKFYVCNNMNYIFCKSMHLNCIFVLFL
uniref:Uncharacterized protein n=1 Tax=Cacopsylla melanoneura TaxID=428564 RepID=A0A8D8RNC3_9HEMI